MYFYIDSEGPQAPTDERELIGYYFNCGYSYAVILEFLGKYHGISISLWTLKTRLNAYGLKRKEHVVDVARVRDLVKKLKWPMLEHSQGTVQFGMLSDMFTIFTLLDKC